MAGQGQIMTKNYEGDDDNDDNHDDDDNADSDEDDNDENQLLAALACNQGRGWITTRPRNHRFGQY